MRKSRAADRRAHFHRQLGDRLADVAVVVHDLRHREPLPQQLMAMSDGAFPDLGARRTPSRNASIS